MLTGLFDEQFLLKKLDQKTDPLARLDSIGDWQIFLPIIEKTLGREDSASAGRKPYPPLLMFKSLLLQSFYKLSDEGVERELLKDLLARRFAGLSGRQFGPDATTIWRFKVTTHLKTPLKAYSNPSPSECLVCRNSVECWQGHPFRSAVLLLICLTKPCQLSYKLRRLRSKFVTRECGVDQNAVPFLIPTGGKNHVRNHC